MQRKRNPTPPPGLRIQAIERTRRLLTLAARHFGARIPEPTIRFDLRGSAAGQLRIQDSRTYVIRYNPQLMARNSPDFVAQTVPHETAHLVAFRLYGPDIRPHGEEWQAIMRLFGVQPKRCHTYNVEGLQTRRLNRFEYHCACRTHRLTSIRHNRVQAGQVYSCRHCGQVLVPSTRPRAQER